MKHLKGTKGMVRNLKIKTFSVALVLSFNVNASVIISPDSVVAAPPTLISGFSYDRTIDQSGLSINFISGMTDFDTYIASDPIHRGTISPQTYAASSHLPDPFLNVDYDLGSTYFVERMAFWNYPVSESGGITGFNVYTSDTPDFLTPLLVGSFFPVSDADRVTRLNEAQVFDLVDSTGRYLRFRITDVETDIGNGFSEIAFDATLVPIPATFWLFVTGLVSIFGLSKRRSA